MLRRVMGPCGRPQPEMSPDAPLVHPHPCSQIWDSTDEKGNHQRDVTARYDVVPIAEVGLGMSMML